MKDIKLLFVDDNPIFSTMVKMGLEDVIGGYDVVLSQNGEEGLTLWARWHPDIIIADIDMPVMDGFDMVKQIRRKDNNVIIIFATAYNSPEYVIEGFEIGINNYIKKPYTPMELNSHIRGLMRTCGLRLADKSRDLFIGCYTLDIKRYMLINRKTGAEHGLTKTEFALMELLIKNKNEVLSRDKIIKHCWNVNAVNTYISRSLDVFICQLRKYLEDDKTIILKTIRGKGLILSEETI